MCLLASTHKPECRVHKRRSCLFCSLLYLHHFKWCLTQNRTSINIFERINEWTFVSKTVSAIRTQKKLKSMGWAEGKLHERVREWGAPESTITRLILCLWKCFLILNYAEIHFQKLLLSPKQRVMINTNNFPWTYLDIVIGHNCAKKKKA